MQFQELNCWSKNISFADKGKLLYVFVNIFIE